MAPLLPAHTGLAAVTPQNLCRTGTSKRRQNLRDPSLTKSPGTRNQGPPSDLARFGVLPPLKHDEMKKGKTNVFFKKFSDPEPGTLDPLPKDPSRKDSLLRAPGPGTKGHSRIWPGLGSFPH